LEDDEGNRTLIEPMSGNVLLGYARLNVPDGLWRLYNKPWDRSRLTQPVISAVAQDIDIGRAFFDSKTDELNFAVSRLEEVCGDGTVRIDNAAQRGPWTLISQGSEVGHGHGNSVRHASGIPIAIDGEEILVRFPKGFANACVMVFSSTR
jgi:hypothetical protein